MSLSFPRAWRAAASQLFRSSLLRAAAILVAGVLGCRDSPPITPPGAIQLSELSVNVTGILVMERRDQDTLTATALDLTGDTVDVPVVWRSSNEKVAIFARGGVLIARDTGTTTIQASSLGKVSAIVGVVVVWTGPSTIEKGTFSPAQARSPGVTLTDSIRVKVTNPANAPVANAKVTFTVTQGGGAVSQATDTTNQAGIAAVAWTMGPAAGSNTVTASVVNDAGVVDTLVANNLVTFTIASFDALTVQSGNNQTALILAELPIAPSVKLVDSLGAPRAGVPITFTAFANGRVASAVVPTAADGVASPGKWTLGDIPGVQRLEGRVEDAEASLLATATGTPIYYTPDAVIAGGFSTCARESGGAVKCWGEVPQAGIGDTDNVSVPTPVKGTLVAASIAGSASHFCALTSQSLAWCWGAFALVDTSGATTTTFEPTRLKSDITWSQIGPGFTHNCAVTLSEIAYCWGNNANGQLGDGTTTTRFVPTPVTGGFSFTQVASGGGPGVGAGHTCGLTNGAAFCWGRNQFGQLGDGTLQSRNGPTAVGGGQTFQWIGAAEIFTCALTPLGRVYCWGNVAGSIQLSPITYPTAPAFQSLTVGGTHACGLTSDATAYCWGLNQFGQLGDSSTTTRAVPTKVAGELRFSQVSAGYLHTCGKTLAGAVACWGFNRSGEIGDSTSQFRTTPRHVVLGVNP